MGVYSTSQYNYGTGVGLYLTKELVKLHDGDIWFDSNQTEDEKRGTTFYIKLPMRSDYVVEREKVLPHDIYSGEIEPSAKDDTTCDIEELYGTRPVVLIVDDNPEILHILHDLLQDNYDLLSANNGQEGLDVTVNRLPDLIISDIMMPVMDGYKLCKSVKSDKRTSHIPIILLSAKSEENDIRKGLRITADGYCTKPFNGYILVDMINTILINRRRTAISFGAAGYVVDSNEKILATEQIFLKRINDYVVDNITNSNLRVEDLCDLMGLTQYQLNKKLRAIGSMTTSQYIRKIRLRHAAELLREGQKSISEITYDVGFSDLRYFRECFKQEFGVLPTQYQKSEEG